MKRYVWGMTVAVLGVATKTVARDPGCSVMRHGTKVESFVQRSNCARNALQGNDAAYAYQLLAPLRQSYMPGKKATDPSQMQLMNSLSAAISDDLGNAETAEALINQYGLADVYTAVTQHHGIDPLSGASVAPGDFRYSIPASLQQEVTRVFEAKESRSRPRPAPSTPPILQSRVPAASSPGRKPLAEKPIDKQIIESRIHQRPALRSVRQEALAGHTTMSPQKREEIVQALAQPSTDREQETVAQFSHDLLPTGQGDQLTVPQVHNFVDNMLVTASAHVTNATKGIQDGKRHMSDNHLLQASEAYSRAVRFARIGLRMIDDAWFSCSQVACNADSLQKFNTERFKLEKLSVEGLLAWQEVEDALAKESRMSHEQKEQKMYQDSITEYEGLVARKQGLETRIRALSAMTRSDDQLGYGLVNQQNALEQELGSVEELLAMHKGRYEAAKRALKMVP